MPRIHRYLLCKKRLPVGFPSLD